MNPRDAASRAPIQTASCRVHAVAAAIKLIKTTVDHNITLINDITLTTNVTLITTLR
jgi:hypothetical protein